MVSKLMNDTIYIISNSLADARQMTAKRVWLGIITGIQAIFMGVKDANKTINTAVVGWDGVSQHLHRYGGTEWRLGRREIGHIHGNYLVDIPFPKKVRDEVIGAGEAEAHHILPDSGWISFYVRQPDDVAQAINLLHRSYKLAVEQQARRKSTGNPSQ
jgi:hypothetical protein